MTENPDGIRLNDKKDELLPEIDLLSLAEERAASAPITDLGVISCLSIAYVQSL